MLSVKSKIIINFFIWVCIFPVAKCKPKLIYHKGNSVWSRCDSVYTEDVYSISSQGRCTNLYFFWCYLSPLVTSIAGQNIEDCLRNFFFLGVGCCFPMTKCKPKLVYYMEGTDSVKVRQTGYRLQNSHPRALHESIFLLVLYVADCYLSKPS